MQQVAIKTISASTTAEILSAATIEQTVDTGATMVTTLKHDKFGYMTIIQNPLEEGALALVSQEAAAQFTE